MTFIIVPAFILFVLSLLLTYLIRQFSLKKNIVDIPNQRSLHKSPTPRGGGLAFVFLFYITVFLLYCNHFIQLKIFMTLLGGIPIATVGYCDDVFNVKALWRAIVHLLSAIWSIAWLGGVPFLNFNGHIFYAPILFFILAIFITVWFVNLYNFMDGIDGLAGMEAVFVSSVAGCSLISHEFYAISIICFALTFSVLGFLCFNWPPAKIFMGDVGSGFLGFIFADFMWITNNNHQLSFPFWWILLSVFIVDATYTLIHRMIQKKNWRQAHREHAYQRLTQAGFTHKKVTIGILSANLLICLPMLDIYSHLQNSVFIIFYLVAITSISWLVWFFIAKQHSVV